MTRKGIRRISACFAVSLFLLSVVLVAVPVKAATVNYPDKTLSGGFQAGHFNDVWDLTAGDIVISFTYDANGLVDDLGGNVAHAWAELGVRSLDTGSDFNPYSPLRVIGYKFAKTAVGLIAGKSVNVGEVIVWSEGNSLYVKYVTKDGCVLTETHLAVATSLAGIPQKNGNPPPGQFPYKQEHNPPVFEYTYTLDLTQWAPGTTLYIAAHSVVACASGTETAWAAGLSFPGKNWATYFTVTPTPISVAGSGVWVATDYDWTANTFAPDPPGAPSLDLDDKIILQYRGGYDEGHYNLPSSPAQYGNNYGFWFDRDGVDQWQAAMWGCVNGGTYNTNGVYHVVMRLHATSATGGTAYVTINGIQQGFYNGPWQNGQPAFYPAGTTFTGDLGHLQVFYGLYGYGATHTVTFSHIIVTQ